MVTLRHEDKYDSWQSDIETIIQSLNDFIIHLNSSNDLATPLCHKCIIRHHGNKKNGYKAISWKLLTDGIHGSKTIKKHWVKSISAAIKKNQPSLSMLKRKRPSSDESSSSDEEPKSPKRSFLLYE